MPGDIGKLAVEFANDINLDEAAHSLVVEFSEGCRTEFVPSVPMVGDDQKVDKKARETHYVRHVGADRLHQEGITGAGVTVAILDTGVWSSGGGKNWLRKDYNGEERVLRTFDAIRNAEGDADDAKDKNGHGSHVTSIILSSRKAQGSGNVPVWNGVAPGVSLVSIKAFDEEGQGTYADVIRGIDWVVQNKDLYGIRVLNLSLSAPPRSHYWDDPLNQAVMEAWRAGVVVVASAGNTGPEPMTVGVPGNVPYVITVGAITNNRTPFDASDDTITSFSAAGPTYEGFVKPEVLAPGGRLLGIMNKGNHIPKEHKNFHDGDSYYYMSGTSQSAAVVSGITALLLQAEPALTPDQVKCKLMSSARPATTPDGALALSIFQQGAGLVNAAAALQSANYSCGNRGLN
ncbi:MAG: S8 family peptidase, partial [Gammaproteobacteria bacterium]|nr:S8 family peptidase [Gammaproteobacteria bacterium]